MSDDEGMRELDATASTIPGFAELERVYAHLKTAEMILRALRGALPDTIGRDTAFRIGIAFAETENAKELVLRDLATILQAHGDAITKANEPQ